MYKLKALILHSRPWQRLYSLSFGRKATTYAQPAYTRSNEIHEVAVKGLAIARIAILNRPSALNAITSPMVDRLSHLYNSWEENKDLGFVVIKGAGRAFCAGSDVVSLYELLNNGEVEEYKAFFQSLYKFIYNLGTYMKPQVAILDGITMGIGAGISVPGLFRVVTDKTVFAMPEVQVGFHPDAGASFYLSRLPGYLGEYLALTGEKLNGVEMIACGLATHYVLNARLDWIEERLSKLMSDDHSVIDSSLSQYGDLVYPDKNSVLHRMETIDKCFCLDSIEEIMDALGKEAADSDDPWFSAVLNKLKEASPLSLKVTLNSVREGRFQTLAQCLAREYRISVNFIRKRVSNDFCEGVRARLVDKDFSPQWNPPSVEAVSGDMVDCHFEALDDEPELELPVDIREPYF